MLWYFLSGEQGGHGQSQAQATNFATTAAPVANLGTDSEDGQDSNPLPLPPPTPAVQFYSHQSSSRHKHHSHSQPPPPQPAATQFVYPPSAAQMNIPSRGSAGSLTLAAESLVNGVSPSLLYSTHRNSNPSLTGEGESPLSPAGMLGTGQENLLLPPPSGVVAAVVPDSGHVMGPPAPREVKTNGDVAAMAPPPVPNASSMPPPPHQSMMAPLLPQAPNGMMPPGMYPATHQQQLMYAAAAVHAASLQRSAPPVVESEEKRARRLERNRVSARKSRRKKKERLVTLGAQVNKLHNDIENIRRGLINSMVPALHECRHSEMRALAPDDAERLAQIVSVCGPSSQMMRSILDFQYNMLKQLTLPSHQKILLWLTLRDERFFVTGKEEYLAKQQQQQQQQKPSDGSTGQSTKPQGKISSKQLGDELFNGGDKKSKKKRGQKKDGTDSDGGAKPNQSCSAYDAAKAWPLFCFDMKLSVDQEEKFLNTHRQVVEGKLKGSQQLPQKRLQMEAAVNTSESMGKAVGSLSHVIAEREERSLVGTLRPSQAADLHEWLAKPENVQRARESVLKRQGEFDNSTPDVTMRSPSPAIEAKEVTLFDICRKLNEVLQISNKY